MAWVSLLIAPATWPGGAIGYYTAGAMTAKGFVVEHSDIAD